MADHQKHKGDAAFRANSKLGRMAEMTYGGALSFLRRPYSRDLQGVDVAIIGVPFDQATTYRSGARLGPRAIRAASVQLAELKAFPFGFDPFDHLSVVDWGDIFIDQGYPMEMVETVMAAVKPIHQAGVKPLCFGGDHFISYPLIKAAHAQYGTLSLVHFDAHGDCWEDDGGRLDHGSMFARAAKEGLIDPARSVQIGLRTWNDDDYGFHIFDAPSVHNQSAAELLTKITDIVGDHPAYFTFDIDCLDPAFAPGTGTPVAGGLSSHQALSLVRGLGGLNWVAGDVVEVAPAYDVSEITAIAAATIAHDFLCLLALKKTP
ncbi:MAG: agmatinase [Alphaproteobacteria bacterium]